jgi:hypothetical protein
MYAGMFGPLGLGGGGFVGVLTTGLAEYRGVFFCWSHYDTRFLFGVVYEFPSFPHADSGDEWDNE